MYDYSLEEGKERIVMPKTKEYFEEVYSSYQLGNYRSALVMLWSVIVCDVIYKLKDLESKYNDSVARTILKDFDRDTSKNSGKNSSQSEMSLFKKVSDRTFLIDSGTIKTIEHIQSYRHMSAHPVLGNDYNLYIPNKDLCRGLIISALTGLFSKPAYLTRKIFDEFTSDIANNKDILISKKEVATYIGSKYVKLLEDNVKLSFVRSLWKLVFKLNDENCKSNRKINRMALEFLTSTCTSNLMEDLEKDSEYYSLNIAVDKKDKIYSLYVYFHNFPKLYPFLCEYAQEQIAGVKKKYAFTVLMSRFLFDRENDFENFLFQSFEDDALLSDFYLMQGAELEKVAIYYSENGISKSLLFKIFSKIYSKACDFDDADEKFSKYIAPYVERMDLLDLKYLMKLIEGNNQTYGRKRAVNDHQCIIYRVKQLDKSFDFDDFPYCQGLVEQ